VEHSETGQGHSFWYKAYNRATCVRFALLGLLLAGRIVRG
jgi:hypothetical protein